MVFHGLTWPSQGILLWEQNISESEHRQKLLCIRNCVMSLSHPQYPFSPLPTLQGRSNWLTKINISTAWLSLWLDVAAPLHSVWWEACRIQLQGHPLVEGTCLCIYPQSHHGDHISPPNMETKEKGVRFCGQLQTRTHKREINLYHVYSVNFTPSDTLPNPKSPKIHPSLGGLCSFLIGV